MKGRGLFPRMEPEIWSRALRGLVLGWIVLAAGGCSEGNGRGSFRRVPVRMVEIRTSDGWRVRGRVYEAAGGSRGGVVLAPMFGKASSSWARLAHGVASAGWTVLCLGSRGRSEDGPGGEGEDETASFRPGDDFRNMVLDVAAAVRFLNREYSIPPDKVAVGGAVLGASLALLFAEGERETPCLILLSPPVVWKGLAVDDAAENLGGRAVFAAASRGDVYSMLSLRELRRRFARGGARVREEIFDGKARGTDLLLSHGGELEKAVVEFLDENMPR